MIKMTELLQILILSSLKSTSPRNILPGRDIIAFYLKLYLLFCRIETEYQYSVAKGDVLSNIELDISGYLDFMC